MITGKRLEYRKPIDPNVIDVAEDDFTDPDATIDAALRVIKFLSTTPGEPDKKKKKK